ncbi:MAG: hypothetical protein Q8O34_17195 [Rhodocyclaceae bacterium]|nr:hypothetical protein [Rhodocyclaceae bacterium]
MSHKQGNSALIAGILVVALILALCKLAWLIFDASPLVAVMVGWIAAALLPFVIRFVVIRLLPKDQVDRAALHL